jgi:cysteine desulfurase/selenocysteine lyase
MLTDAQVAALRDETPGCAQRVHLNNAGAALPTRRTLDTVISHLTAEATIGGYEAAAAAAEARQAVHSSAARLLGAAPEEIALTTSDTTAWTKAFWGFALAGGLEPSLRIVVDQVVYSSHYLALLQASTLFGAEIVVIGAGADGTVALDLLHEALERPTALVTVTHVPTSSGLVNPVAAVGEIARAAGVPFFLDACQSVGQLPVDVEAFGCDVLTATGRKWLRGPRGTGLLYLRRDFAPRIEPLGIDMTSADWIDHDTYQVAAGAQRAEEFEGPVAAQLGLGAAIDQLLDLGVDAVSERIALLATHLRDALDRLDGVEALDGTGPRSGIVTFVVDGRPAQDVATRATAAGINVSVSRAEDARLDLDGRGLAAVVRASPHAYNTTDELDLLVEVVADT